jgi:uncharacterized protein (DUF58 family)
LNSDQYFDPLVISRLSNLQLRARHVVEGLMSGVHRSRSRGFSVDFEEHRAYTPGDELRHVDWKAYGKFDRYLVKQYEDETNLYAHLVVDASASMDFGDGVLSKWAYAATLSSAMAHLLLGQSDSVGLVVSHETEDTLVPSKSIRKHLLTLLAGLQAASPDGGTGIARSMLALAERLKRRGLIVVVSDLLDDPEAVEKALKLLCLKGNDVIVFHILDSVELEFPFEGLARMDDVETDRNITVECEVVKRPYLGLLEEFLEETRERCADLGVDYHLVSTAEPLDRGLIRFLAWRSRSRV